MIEPQLLTEIARAQRCLIISHIKPDGDAVGSLLGLGWLLQRLGKQPTLALQDPVPDEHQTLPGAASILTAAHPDYRTAVQATEFDAVICVDSSSPDRMGNAYVAAVHGGAPLLIIDHHITNTRFGSVNWVAPDCAAACQMVAYLADALGVALDGELAECLLTGLVTDTLCFRTSNTDAAVLEVAMRLMQGGANLAAITGRTVNRQPFAMIRLWSLLLPTVQLDDGVIWATADERVFAQAGLPVGDIGLSSYLVTADEAAMSAVFVEKPDEQGNPTVECSFRAKPSYSVAQVALALGGGGHPAAAGATVAGTLAQRVPEIVQTLQTARQAQLTAHTQPM
jgi:phosphoesterase RecJ-like protein